MATDPILFVSDIHLSGRYPERTERFRELLKSSVGRFSSIYILGDLFDYWIGKEQLTHPSSISAVSALRDITRRIPVHFIRGNRDFYADSHFSSVTGVHMLGDEHEIVLDGKRVFLTHGDLLATFNRSYPLFRRFSRSPLGRGIFSFLPPNLKHGMAKGARRVSSSLNSTQARTGQTGLIKRNITRIFDRGFDFVICGHVHTQFSHDFGNNKVLFVLGDWGESGTCLSYMDKKFSYI